MITASARVMRVTPPMNAPAPMRAKAPGSIQAQGEGGRKTPGGALRGARGWGGGRVNGWVRWGWEGQVGGWLGRRSGSRASRETPLSPLPPRRECCHRPAPSTPPHAASQPARWPAHPSDPAPCAAAMSTVTSPTIRPMQAPISSMGTNTPLLMAAQAGGRGGRGCVSVWASRGGRVVMRRAGGGTGAPSGDRWQLASAVRPTPRTIHMRARAPEPAVQAAPRK